MIFSEEYIAELQNILSNLFAEGPSRKATEYVYPLYEIRKKYRLWISPSMANTLDDFEKKVGKIGISYGLWESTSQYQKGTSTSLDEAYDLFKEVMEIEASDNKQKDIETIKHKGYNLVIEHLQNILGIEELTELRDTIIKQSHEKT